MSELPKKGPMEQSGEFGEVRQTGEDGLVPGGSLGGSARTSESHAIGAPLLPKGFGFQRGTWGRRPGLRIGLTMSTGNDENTGVSQQSGRPKEAVPPSGTQGSVGDVPLTRPKQEMESPSLEVQLAEEKAAFEQDPHAFLNNFSQWLPTPQGEPDARSMLGFKKNWNTPFRDTDSEEVWLHAGYSPLYINQSPAEFAEVVREATEASGISIEEQARLRQGEELEEEADSQLFLLYEQLRKQGYTKIDLTS